LALNNRDLELV